MKSKTQLSEMAKDFVLEALDYGQTYIAFTQGLTAKERNFLSFAYRKNAVACCKRIGRDFNSIQAQSTSESDQKENSSPSPCLVTPTGTSCALPLDPEAN